MPGYAGEFLLATPVGGHPAETRVQVTVSALHPSRLVLEFDDNKQVLTDARVLLCGHIGALELVGLGYTGPLVRRPPVGSGRTIEPSRPR